MASQSEGASQGPPAAAPAADKDKEKKNLTPAKGSQDTETTQRCKHCGKQVDRVGFSTHSKQCLRSKKEARQKELKAKQREQEIKEAKERGEEPPAEKDAEAEVDDSVTGTNPAGEGTSETPTTATDKKKPSLKLDLNKGKKKRKAEDDASSITSSVAKEKPPPKKQKKKADAAGTAPGSATKAATGGGGGGGGKPKGPVDVERQCGVLLPNGAMCARSLTCKSHSMGAKRSVPGRSLPYDTLLQRYQKKNQAKQQKAALAASGQPLPEDLALDGVGPDGTGGKVDSDEECGAVMEGIRRALAAPRPLYERPVASVRSRVGLVRIKESLANALGGSRGGGLFATSAQTSRDSMDDGSNQMQPQSAQGQQVQSSADSRRGSQAGGGLQARRQLSLSLGPLDATRRRQNNEVAAS